MRALDETFSLKCLLISLSVTITKLRFSPVLPSYLKQVWDYLKQVLVFTNLTFRRRAWCV